MCYTCILFSESLNKYYIGSTALLPEQRLLRHLEKHCGYTSKANDWKIVYYENYNTLSEARKRELQLKKWKNAARIAQLIKRSTE